MSRKILYFFSAINSHPYLTLTKKVIKLLAILYILCNNYSMDINKKIKEIREKRGLTQAKLAKMIGKDRSQVSRYETDAKISASVLYSLADALNVKVDEFFK